MNNCKLVQKVLSIVLMPFAIPMNMVTPQAFTFTPLSGSCPSSSSLAISSRPNWRIRAESSMVTEKLGIKVERNPPESKLAELGVRNWPKLKEIVMEEHKWGADIAGHQNLKWWGCPPSKFPWTYDAKEKCYLLEGKVKVYPEGHGDESVDIGAGDFVEFPKGMTCTWDVSVAVDKHYMFE